MTDSDTRSVVTESHGRTLVTEAGGITGGTTYAYSLGAAKGGVLALAGQCGVLATGEVAPTFDGQCARIFERIDAILAAAGSSKEDIISMTVFLTDIRLGHAFTRLRREYFGSGFPASAVIGVASLMPEGALIEIQALAVLTPEA